MASITLSAPEFKALASETRTSVLKFLAERNHTLSELAQKLDLAMPTVKAHLEQLENAGLVEILDDGHKWKYYRLSKKGNAILQGHAEPLPVFILLGASTIFAIALFIGLWTGTPSTPFLAQNSHMELTRTAPLPQMKAGIEHASGSSPNLTMDSTGLPADENAVETPTPSPAPPNENTQRVNPILLLGLVIASGLSGYFLHRAMQA